MVKISQLLTGINQETENIGEKMKTLSRKSIGSLSAILLAGVLAVGQGSLFMASAAETGSVDSAVCTSTSSYSINLTGNFPGLVTDVGVNYLNIPRALWTKSTTNILVKVPASDPTPEVLMVYFGEEFLIVSVTCPAITGSATDTTEDGGELPDTGSNNYNYLVAGIGLALVGARGLLRRKPIQE